jgi:hypothetical protein
MLSIQLRSGKQSGGNQELISQQNAVVKYINTKYTSQDFDTEPIFKLNHVGIPAKDMISLTLPPGIKEVEKFVACNVSIPFCPISAVLNFTNMV